MEMLNKVEIKGRICAVKVTRISETSLARMSVLTECIYKNHDGQVCIESTRHTVVLWEGKTASRETIESLANGDAVHIIGRIRNQRYIDSEGAEKIVSEILAYQFEKLI